MSRGKGRIGDRQKKGRRGEGKERKMQRKVVVSTTPLVMDKR